MKRKDSIMFNSDYHRYKERGLRARLSFEMDQERLFKSIDKIPGLAGAGVVYIDSSFTVVELRPYSGTSLAPTKIVLREQPRNMNQAEFAGHLKNSQNNVRESRLVGEIAGTVLSCSAAVLGWIVVFGSAAAIPLSGGTSSAVIYLAVAASTASSLQCINGGVRTYNESVNPELNDLYDSKEWYQNVTMALDVISLAGAAAAGAATLKAVKLLKANTNKSTVVLLKGLTRSERKRLTQDIIRMNHPGVSNNILKRMVRTGQFPKRYSGLQITQALKLQIKDAVGASISFSGSALSGGVNSLAVGIYEEFSK